MESFMQTWGLIKISTFLLILLFFAALVYAQAYSISNNHIPAKIKNKVTLEKSLKRNYYAINK